MTFFGKRIPLFFSLFVWFFLWELVGRAEYSIIIPPVSRVFVAAITILPTAKFAAAASISLRSFALGMALAIVIGLPVGILMARLENLGNAGDVVGTVTGVEGGVVRRIEGTLRLSGPSINQPGIPFTIDAM